MRTARLFTTFIVAGTLGMFFACGDSAEPLGSGEIVINDTAGQDVNSPPAAQAVDSGSDAADANGPTVSACGSCSCDQTKNYCFSGPSGSTTLAYDSGAVTDSGSDSSDGNPHGALPLGAFGEPDGAADTGPPPPPCAVLAARSTQPGCTPLPPPCTAAPTCACLLKNLQPEYPSCYLVCTPSPGYFEVYCGG